jgi:hypothetical protein
MSTLGIVGIASDISIPQDVPRKKSADTPPPESFAFDPAPYIPPAPAKIPRREWLVVSATLGAPGRLKSTVGMTDAISIASGLDLILTLANF